MGWTAFNFQGTRAEFVAHEFRKDEYGEVIDFAVVGTTIYMAYKIGPKFPDEQGKIKCLVVLTGISKKDHCNFRYKDMTESMGPNESKCPLRIIKQLTPVDDLYEDALSRQYAQEWRNRCIAYADEKKNASKIKITPGTAIKIDHVLSFKNGYTEDTFINVTGSTWRSNKHYFLAKFKPSRFKFEILPV